MKKTVKIASAILAVLMLASTTACNSASDQGTSTNAATAGTTQATSTEPVATEPELAEGQISAELLTLTAFQYVQENQQVDFNNLWFYQELEAKTNIHIEWELVKDADWKTKLNLMFASGDLPDMILRNDVDIEEYGVAQGLLVPLDDYIDTYMPNYASRLSMNDANASIPASDGKSYWIGYLVAQNVNHDGNHYINKTWLDNLGMEIPTTIDELTDVLIAFRDQDPNGNSEPDEIPFSGGDLIHQTQGLYTHFANFGVPLERFVYACILDNDEIVFPGYMDGFREACEWLNMCYAEGLLDMESITQDSTVWATKMNANQVGYTTYLRLINTALDSAIAEQFVSITPPASEFGVSVPRILEVPAFGAALTASNEHVTETLQWLDAQLETETMMVAANGPLQDGGPIDPTISINDDGKYEILYVPEDNGLYNHVPVSLGQFFAPGDYYFDIYEMPSHRVERYESSQAYEDAGVLESKSYYYLYKMVKMSNEDSIEREKLYNQIETFMKESIANFIARGVTDDNWQEFLNNANSVGVDRYIELYQNAYNDYLANN